MSSTSSFSSLLSTTTRTALEMEQLTGAGIVLGITLPVISLILVSIVMLTSREAVARVRRRRRRAFKRRLQERTDDLMTRLIALQQRLIQRQEKNHQETQGLEDTTTTTTAEMIGTPDYLREGSTQDAASEMMEKKRGKRVAE